MLFTVLLSVPAARIIVAQTPTPTAVVRVHVADTAQAPVAGADVSIVQGLNEIIGRGTTDNEGRVSISVTGALTDLQLSVRKLGYTAGTQFFVLPKSGPATMEFMLRRAVQTLAPVTVTAAEDVKRKSYHIDADVIAASDRPLYDAMDIVTKLLPDVIEGREGKGSGCGVQDVWVNGMRIVFPPGNEMVMSRIGHAPAPPPKPGLVMQSGGASGRVAPHSSLVDVDSSVWLALATVKPEHIAEMTYEDCHSTTVTDHTHASNALFIVLKPGVGYDASRGSYVLADRETKSKPVKSPPVRSPAPSLPGYRARLVGVYDGTTGDPVQGVTVTDSASGTRAETTVTGTITLAFLPEGVAVLRISKPGYIDEREEVLISPRDSLPLTIVLTRVPARDSLLERRQVSNTRDAEAFRGVSTFQGADDPSAAPGIRAIDEKPRQDVEVLVFERKGAERVAGK
jgi:hypothetical protein